MWFLMTNKRYRNHIKNLIFLKILVTQHEKRYFPKSSNPRESFLVDITTAINFGCQCN
jgi:hypothetical protein